jgi:hypothetical protein
MPSHASEAAAHPHPRVVVGAAVVVVVVAMAVLIPMVALLLVLVVLLMALLSGPAESLAASRVAVVSSWTVALCLRALAG